MVLQDTATTDSIQSIRALSRTRKSTWRPLLSLKGITMIRICWNVVQLDTASRGAMDRIGITVFYKVFHRFHIIFPHAALLHNFLFPFRDISNKSSHSILLLSSTTYLPTSHLCGYVSRLHPSAFLPKSMGKKHLPPETQPSPSTRSVNSTAANRHSQRYSYP